MVCTATVLLLPTVGLHETNARQTLPYSSRAKHLKLLVLVIPPEKQHKQSSTSLQSPVHNTTMPSSSCPPRTSYIERNTKETKIQLHLSLDGGALPLLPSTTHFFDFDGSKSPSTPSTSHLPQPILGLGLPGPTIPPQSAETHASQTSAAQQIWIWTGIGFLDHMLHAWAKHAGWSLRLRAKGDLASTSTSHLFHTPPPPRRQNNHLTPTPFQLNSTPPKAKKSVQQSTTTTQQKTHSSP